MSIPDYQTLMLSVLKKAATGEVKISTVVEELSNEMGLTDDEKAELLPTASYVEMHKSKRVGSLPLSCRQIARLSASFVSPMFNCNAEPTVSA